MTMETIKQKAGPILYIIVWFATIWFFVWLDGLS
jgi:hypothetical protein